MINESNKVTRVAVIVFVAMVASSVAYLAQRSATVELNVTPETPLTENATNAARDAANDAASGDEHQRLKKKYRVQGPSSKADPHLARARALEEAAKYGLLPAAPSASASAAH